MLIILTGFFASAFIAFITIKGFLRFVEKIGMTPFVLYRVVLGVALLIL
jgi:undecaprenyl-diphosphatase